MDAGLDQTVGKNTTQKESLTDVADILQRLRLEAEDGNVDSDLSDTVDGLGLALGVKPTRADKDAVEAWVRTVEDAGVAERLVADLKDGHCAGFVAQTSLDWLVAQLNIDSDDEGNSSADDKHYSPQPVNRPRPLPYADVAKKFGALEEVAEWCGVAEVSYNHLGEAKLGLDTRVGVKTTK